ncbi:MAG: hypothetical protein RMM10_04415 [Anaerolineae bacterium]|uniref:hypothetical protein n=1 Tax=Thermoflexus sp. TaxID=1969742 RepID=UPI0025E05B5E|nr:hypothetical protein [Thermoflexus sp.]MCS7350751.1 hypothetical protein [Thermoflexus sp.]MDW8180202.1 hypothetical protein [Anaerolineae bacterium]
MSRWIPALLLSLLALTVELSLLAIRPRVPRWGQFLIEIGAPLLGGPLPLGLALWAGWLSLRDVGLVGPHRLAPGALLGWLPADWIRGIGLASLYGGATLLALRGAGLWRPGPLPRRERLERAFAGLAREALVALGRGILMAALFRENPLPAAWIAFGIWWGTWQGVGKRVGIRPGPEVWGGALTATALFGLTGHLWLSAALHALIAAALAGPASREGAG